MAVCQKKGVLVIPPKYKKIGISTKNIIELINDEGKSFIFDSNGKQYPQTLKRSYYFLDVGYRFFHFGMARAENDGKWGYIDYKGNLVINYQYEDAGEFNGDFAAIRLNGKCGIINKRNEMIVPPTFDKVFIEDYGFKVANGKYEYEDSFCLGFRGKWGLINFKGNLIYPLGLHSEYDIKEIGNDIIAIQVDKKWELINITGKIISLPIFDAIGDCKGEYITVSIEKKEAIINTIGEYIISPIYAKVHLLTDRYAAISVDAKHYNVVDLRTGEKDINIYYKVGAMLYGTSTFKLYNCKGWRLYNALNSPISDYFDNIESVYISQSTDTDD